MSGGRTLSPRERGLLSVARRFDKWSQVVIGRPLRPYQLEPAAAILDSVFKHRGLTFVVMMSRQAGKNELSAQLEHYLLTTHSRVGGSIVKAAPTFRPQIVNSMLRLGDIAKGSELTNGLYAQSQGYIIAIGRARLFCFSAGPDSSIVGATASLLLEVDEAQDVEEAKFDKDLAPMGASTNVTTVMYGTAWTADTLLEKARAQALREEEDDGIRRAFIYPWSEVGKHNEAYRIYVSGQLTKKGTENVLMKTQYLLESVDAQGKMISSTQRAQLTGAHPRQLAPSHAVDYIAALDVAGEAEEDEDAALRAAQPRKDSTCLTIAEVIWSPEEGGPPGAQLPWMWIVQHYYWTGRKHAELFPILIDLLKNVWKVRSVTVDATGVGAPVASFMTKALGPEKCHPFTFGTQSKSALGYQLLDTIDGGRLKMYADDGSEESAEFWWEVDNAHRQLYAHQTMRFSVPESLGHDDFLMSMALLPEAAIHSKPRVATGRAKASAK